MAAAAGRPAGDPHRVAALLDFIQMPDRGASPVAALSGGQQQRVALARALDLTLREAMQLKLARIQRRCASPRSW